MVSIEIVVQSNPIVIDILPQVKPNIEIKYGKVDSVNGESGDVLINAVPNGGTTGQILAKNSDADNDTEWVNQSGGGGGTWGSITGTLSAQTDLQTALNAKQNSLGFTPENVSNKQTDLTASATKYPTVDAVNTGLSSKLDAIDGGFVFNLLNNPSTIPHTGTTSETKVYSALIPANTIKYYDQIRFYIRQLANNSGNNKTQKWYVNTSDSIPAATQQIATYTFTSSSASMKRDMWLIGTNFINQLLRTTSYSNDDNTTFNDTALSAVAFDPSVDNYFIVTETLAVGTDTVTIYQAYAQVIRK